MSNERYGLDAAIEHLQRIKQMRPNSDWRLTVSVSNIGGLSAHQTVDVKAIGAGFDWTAGQVLIEPAKPLTWLTPDQVEDITKSVRAGSSWHAYEREKKLRTRIKALEAEVARLREGSLVGREPDSDRRAEPEGQEPGRNGAPKESSPRREG